MLKKLLCVMVGGYFSVSCMAEVTIISGEVKGDEGRPEAGVWVIAETADLPTEYRKIVVTDELGRFVLPELPSANYDVWVRGYGLADSAKQAVAVGSELVITVTAAASLSEAAAIYPASYWLALLQPPPAEEFGKANDPYGSQAGWNSQLKLNCVLCHQLGSAMTRLPNQAAFAHGLKKSSGMDYFADALGRQRLLSVLGDWGERIAAGETPAQPRRPEGVERNFVITQWGWGDSYTYSHDQVATDKRDPTLYANAPIYAVDLGNDYLLSVDPVTHTATRIKIPTVNGFDTAWCEQTYKPLNGDTVSHYGFGSLGCPAAGGVTAYAGRYDNPANPHNPMMDSSGKVWLTTQIRREWGEDMPAFCQASAIIADNYHHRQLAYYDTRSKAFVPVDTCYGTHHLQFDDQGVLWTSGDNHVIGWFDPAKFSLDDPASLEAAQGFSQVIVDGDGDGVADTPIVGFHYGVIPNSIDGSVWTAVPPGIASPVGESGHIHRYDPSSDTHEVFAPPLPGLGPRGIDVDSKGVIWTALAGSGHVARFDRSVCKQTWGTGKQCPEGWTLWESPGPQFKGVTPTANDGSTDMHYYLWVDQFDTLGMGVDSVIINGTGSDSLLSFDPATGSFTVIRIPYPLNTYTRGLDGRIDNPLTSWKGRGLWFTNGLDPVIHSEIPKSYVAKVQLRPHPLAH